MTRLKIGLCLRALGMPLRAALPELRKLQVAGVELDATGELAPAQLSQTGRRELKFLLRSFDLELTALACPLRRGLGVPENQQARVDYLRQALSLSWDLGAKTVIIEPGPLPAPKTDHGATAAERPSQTGGILLGTAAGLAAHGMPDLLTDALTDLARHADRIGAALALETGLESGPRLAEYLAGFDSAGLAANFNPGNLLVHGHDPYAAVQALRGKIVHVHARDARIASASRGAEPVALGHGDIDWLQLLARLEEIEYRGFVTIEQTPRTNGPAEAKAAVEFLRRIIR